MPLQKRPIAADDIKHIAVVSEPHISEEGTKYAFIKKYAGEDDLYYSHIYIQHLTDDKPVQWTFGEVRDHSPQWAPDGSELLFLSSRSGSTQIWLMSSAGGEPRQYTNVKGGISEAAWAPDSQSIAFIASVDSTEVLAEDKPPEEKKSMEPLLVNRLKYKSDAKGFHDETRQHAALLDLKSNKTRLLTKGPFDHSGLNWSPDSKRLVLSANRNEDEDSSSVVDLFVLHLETEELEKMTESTGVFTMANWSGDGKYIAAIGHELEYEGATINQVWIINSHTKENTCMTLKWDVQIGDAAIGDVRSSHPNPGPVWSKDQKHIYFLASERGSTGLYQMDMLGEIEAVHEEENHLFGFSYHAAKDFFIAGISDPSNPGDFFEIQQKAEAHVRLTDVNNEFLKNVDISIPEPLSFKAEDGWEIHGWLMRPAQFEEGQKYPLVLEIHGGPHAMYANTFFHEMQYLAAQGYAVLYMNPRGSHGYGQSFVDAVRGDYGGKDYTDLMSAVDYALQTYSFLDESRLGVTGGSYGGFMTNWIVGHTNRFKAAVTQRSISNWLSFQGVSDIGFFFTEWELKKSLPGSPEELWNFSPLKYINHVSTPLLIMHGEQDFRCPIEQGEQLFIGLKKLGKTVEFLRFPHSNHELSRGGPPALRIHRLEYMAEWFNRYL